MKLGLISCTKSKQDHPSKAIEMYQPSNLFNKASRYAQEHYDRIGILSAKHGLLLPDEEIEPYDLTLRNMGVKDKRKWAEKVHKELYEKLDMKKNKAVYIHAGKDYREHLTQLLEEDGVEVHVPLEGLAFGEQLQWYNERLE